MIQEFLSPIYCVCDSAIEDNPYSDNSHSDIIPTSLSQPDDSDSPEESLVVPSPEMNTQPTLAELLPFPVDEELANVHFSSKYQRKEWNCFSRP